MFFLLQYTVAHDNVVLSPFLFYLAKGLLAMALGKDDKLSGMTRNEKRHKVSLYADDLLIYL